MLHVSDARARHRGMRRFFKQLRGVLWMTAAVMPLLAAAQSLGDGRSALVTIRFNQANVYFDQQLTSAITRVMQVKPDAVFDVVAFAPSSGNALADRQWQAIAGRNTKGVVNAMLGLGISMEQMNVIGKSTPGLKYDETRIYVR